MVRGTNLLLMAAVPSMIFSTMLALVRSALSAVTRPAPFIHLEKRYLSMRGVACSSQFIRRRLVTCLMLSCSASLPASTEKVKPLSWVMVISCTVSPSSVRVPKRVEPERV